MTADPRWKLRPVPAALVRRYEAEGWWTDATLGGMLAERLAAAPATSVDIW